MLREEVYAAIDSERDYQDELRRTTVNRPGSPISNLAVIEVIAAEMKQHFYDKPGQPPMDFMRKIAAVAVRTMEEHGAPVRAGHGY